jgi:hypothetical protein
MSTGIILVVGSRPWSSFAWLLQKAEGHDPYHWGQGSPQVRKVSRLRPLSWIPSHSEWGHTRVLSICIQTMGFIPVATVVWCCLIGAAWHRDGIWLDWGDCCSLGPCEVSAACLLLLEQAYWAMLYLSPSCPRGHDGGEVTCLSCG